MWTVLNVDSTKCFTTSDSVCHGHSLKLYKQHVKLNARKFFFTQRIINAWDDLPESVIQCQSVNTFKQKFDCHLELTGD